MQRASDVAKELPALGPLFTADNTVDLDVAWWQHVVRLFGALDSYRPARCSECPLMLRTFYTNLEALAEACLPDKHGKYGATAQAFGQWRAHVTEVEAENARRLELVADAVARLREMRERTAERPPDLVLLDDMVRDLSQFIYAQYRVVPPAEQSKLRLWCQRQTRRYDLLPREWRGL